MNRENKVIYFTIHFDLFLPSVGRKEKQQDLLDQKNLRLQRGKYITDQMVCRPGIRVSFFLLLFKILVIVQNCGGANETLTQSQPLLVGQSLISPGEIFELGFFVPGNSSKRYVGIWHKIIPANRIVWVANRENALSANDSASRLIIGRDGNLKLMNGKQKIFWSTNVTVPSNSTVALVNDKGELILKDNFSGLVLWESFNSPADTFLPNMMLGYNFRTGEKRFLRSWKTDTDPAPGEFVVGLFEESPPQIFTWNGSKPYWRGGPWDGWKFIGIQDQDAGYQSGMNLAEDNQQGTVYLTYNLFNNSYISMAVIEPSGLLKIWQWYEQLNRWKITWQGPENPCGVYGTCGPFGVCSMGTSPICQRLKGFLPKSDDEWDRGNWTSGCVRRTQLICERNSSNKSSLDRSQKDGFWKLSEIKLPDIYEYLYDIQDAQGCQQWCLGNCSCAAYAYPSGIGCMVWVKDLIDIHQFSSAGEDLYIRLANSELGNSI